VHGWRNFLIPRLNLKFIYLFIFFFFASAATAGIIFFLYASPTFRLYNNNNIKLMHRDGISRAYYYYYYYYITTVIAAGRRSQSSPLLLVGGRTPPPPPPTARNSSPQKKRFPPGRHTMVSLLYFWRGFLREGSHGRKISQSDVAYDIKIRTRRKTHALVTTRISL